MIYTGYFDKIETYKEKGFIPVSIAGLAPEWYDGAQYKKLAPKRDWWQKWHDENLSNEWYCMQYYKTVLHELNAQEVFKDLQQFGEKIILLCYEENGQFCHRHIVADWLNKHHIKTQEFDLNLTTLKQTEITR